MTQQPSHRISADQRTLAILTHLSTLVIGLLTSNVLAFIAPLIVWLICRDKPGYDFVRRCAAKAFNFNVTLGAVNLVLWVLTFLTLGLAGIITLPLICLVYVASLVFHIIAAVKASNLEVYEYPLQIRVLS